MRGRSGSARALPSPVGAPRRSGTLRRGRAAREDTLAGYFRRLIERRRDGSARAVAIEVRVRLDRRNDSGCRPPNDDDRERRAREVASARVGCSGIVSYQYASRNDQGRK